MKLDQVYYHQGSAEVWKKNNQKDWILELINNPNITIAPRVTGKIRNFFRDELLAHGWSDEINLSTNTDLTINAKKDDLAIQIQTGNVCRAAYDLLKLQYLYLEGDIKASALIVPSKYAAKKIGSNLANYERLYKEIQLFRKVITVPIILISFE